MERLTKRVGTHVIYDGEHSRYEGGDIAAEMRTDAIRDTLRRLAAYEDTGLEPQEIAEIAKAGRQLIEQIDLQKLVDALVETIPSIVQAIVENMPAAVEAYVVAHAADPDKEANQ